MLTIGVMRWLAIVFLLFSAQSSALGAAHERRDLKWGELERVLGGRRVAMVLPDGTNIEGRVLAFSSAALVIDVKKTSNRQTYPKGQISIPRSSVSVLQFTQIRGRWRAIGTAIGAGASAVVGTLVYTRFNNEANPESGAALAAGIVAGGAAAGYFAGRGADRNVTVITIVPD